MKKFQEVMQDKHDNPSQFLDQPAKIPLQYTSLDPETPGGKQLLRTYFFSQSFPAIRAKLKCPEKEPLTPQAEVLAMPLMCIMGEIKSLKAKIPDAGEGLLTGHLPRLPGLPKTKNLRVPLLNVDWKVTGPGPV